uniref:Uncharacterized protein n=1 Tax=Candidatus Kentrum sp. SD TaxID=2126332 RepID=A0A451BR52_9GAMM|nr:MAG: hypothetical protein BECKSD772D_GA0070982_11537 [Candidatus Kentron sp. SD]
MSHDQNFKNLILDYPHAALAFFAREEITTIPPTAKITPVRQEQLQAQLGKHFRELDTPLLVEPPEGEREAVLFIMEEETTVRHFSIYRLAHYCLDLAELLGMERVVPVVIFLRPGDYPHSLRLGTARKTYLGFEFLTADLGTMPAMEYVDSRNIVARINLPNMRHEPNPPPRCRNGVNSPYLPAYAFLVPGDSRVIAPPGEQLSRPILTDNSWYACYRLVSLR